MCKCSILHAVNVWKLECVFYHILDKTPAYVLKLCPFLGHPKVLLLLTVSRVVMPVMIQSHFTPLSPSVFQPDEMTQVVLCSFNIKKNNLCKRSPTSKSIGVSFSWVRIGSSTNLHVWPANYIIVQTTKAWAHYSKFFSPGLGGGCYADSWFIDFGPF